MKDKVVFKQGEFTDFTGKTRQVTFCAISVVDYAVIANLDCSWQETEKCLFLGLSVQNFNDEIANPELGKVIAEGKARKEKTRIGTLYSTSKGMINNRMVNALLEQELEYFKQNPGAYLKGYNKDKELFKDSPEKYFAKFKK